MQSLKNSWQCFFSFIACIIFMTGCGQQTPESTAAPQTSIPQTASEQRKGLTSLQNADGFVYGATTEEGFYHVQESDEADGSLNIYYTDYSSLQTVILCSQPNCNHHSESCTGWVPYTGNGVSLMAVGEQLVLVYPGGSGTDKDGTPMFPRIQTADPDGNNRRTVVSFEANQEFFGPYLTDGKSLYARQDTYTDQGCDSALVAVNLETGEASTIFSLNSDEGDAIWGAADEFVFVRHMEIDENGAISGTQLDRVNINTQEKRSVYHWDSLGQRVMLFGSTLICYTASTNELSRVDCLSGERTLLAQNALPQNAETGNVNLIWYDDGNLLLSYSLEGENTPHFVVFEEKTGRFSECGLHYHATARELPVCVVGEIPAQDSYLVLCDEVTVDSVSNLYSGARTAPVYAQIKKEEYWAGNNRNQRRCTGA